MASLSDLPDELVLLLAKACRPPERSALTRTNRRLHDLVTSVLYKHNVDNEGGSAMFWAAQHGSIATLERLRYFGAEVNDNYASHSLVVHQAFYPYRTDLPYDTYFTPLHVAAKFGQDAAVTWLLDHGARIEARALNLCACQPGLTGIAMEANFNPLLSPLSTPLHIAVCNSHATTARLLVSRGADVHADRGGMGLVLHTATRRNSVEIVRFLLEDGQINVDERDSVGYAPLHLACMQSEDLSVMNTLLQYGAYIEVESEDGSSPLLFAFMKGYFKAALELLCSGACLDDINLPDSYELLIIISPIHHFFPSDPPPEQTWQDDQEHLFRRLLKLGCDVDQTYDGGGTLLHAAIDLSASPRTLQYLLDEGLDPNALDWYQRTPLHIAFVSKDFASVVDKIVPLIQRGGRLDIPCKEDCCAFDLALKMGRSDGNYAIISIIFQYASTANFGPEFLTKFVRSSYDNKLFDECRLLIRHGASLDMSEKELRQGMRSSAYDRDVSELLFLVDTFPNHVTPCKALTTALYYGRYSFAEEREGAVLKALLDRPDLDVRSHGTGNASPLHMACRYYRDTELVQQLLDMGSEVNIFDEDYETPLSCAVIQQCPHTMRMLLRHGADPFIAPAECDWESHIKRTGGRRLHICPDLDSAGRYYHNAFYQAMKVGSSYLYNSASSHNDDSEGPHLLEIMLEYHSLPPLTANPSTHTYMHAALDNPQALEILLNKGAVPDVAEHCDRPLLPFEVKEWFPWEPSKIVALLLRFGVDISQGGSGSGTFLNYLKEAVAAMSDFASAHAASEFDRRYRPSALMRYFKIVVNGDTREERVEMRSHEEIVNACSELERRKQTYYGWKPYLDEFL